MVAQNDGLNEPDKKKIDFFGSFWSLRAIYWALNCDFGPKIGYFGDPDHAR